jgi:DNA-binding beta-propeller fold protein YncE
VTDFGDEGLQVFDSSGKFLSSFGSSGRDDGRLRSPRGVAVAPSGNIYVVERNNSRIQVLAPVVTTVFSDSQ